MFTLREATIYGNALGFETQLILVLTMAPSYNAMGRIPFLKTKAVLAFP